MVRRLLVDAGRDDLLDSAQLLVSEVVTNALVHGGAPIDVSMAVAANGVLVEVGDGSKHTPARRNYAPTASTGRGLALLEETADAWGVVPGVGGKTVWFQITSGADLIDDRVSTWGPRPGPVPAQTGLDGTVRIELLNVPLLLHEAWQQHATAVLREYLLASMEYESDDEPLAVHAQATDAMALLEEHIPRPDIGTEPDQVMAAAIDPGLSSPRVELAVPVTSVSHFDLLSTVLDAGLTMAEEGQLLVPVVQPEMRALRRWMCGQVRDQAAGLPARAWRPAHGIEPHRVPSTRVDFDALADAPQAVVAADDLDLVVAASDRALDLLGYRREELLGQRLVTLIPHRYRQAHLAGFTLHLLTGREPLLGKPVVAPALRRDGTEVSVELLIEAQRDAQGERIFLATLGEVPDAVSSGN